MKNNKEDKELLKKLKTLELNQENTEIIKETWKILFPYVVSETLQIEEILQRVIELLESNKWIKKYSDLAKENLKKLK